MRILALLAPVDTRFANADEEETTQRAQVWASIVVDAGVPLEYLERAIKRVYSRPERPLNPLGALIGEARTIRNGERRFDSRALPPVQRSSEPASKAYAAHDAITRTCPECGAGPGEFCTTTDPTCGTRLRKIPHVHRLTSTPAAA